MVKMRREIDRENSMEIDKSIYFDLISFRFKTEQKNQIISKDSIALNCVAFLSFELEVYYDYQFKL